MALGVQAAVEAHLHDGDVGGGDEAFQYCPRAVIQAALRVAGGLLFPQQADDAGGQFGVAFGGIIYSVEFVGEVVEIVQGGRLSGRCDARAFGLPLGGDAEDAFDFAVVFVEQFVAVVLPFFGVGGVAYGIERAAVADEQYGQFHDGFSEERCVFDGGCGWSVII